MSILLYLLIGGEYKREKNNKDNLSFRIFYVPFPWKIPFFNEKVGEVYAKMILWFSSVFVGEKNPKVKAVYSIIFVANF